MATDSTGRDRKAASVAKHETRPKLDTQTASIYAAIKYLVV